MYDSGAASRSWARRYGMLWIRWCRGSETARLRREYRLMDWGTGFGAAVLAAGGDGGAGVVLGGGVVRGGFVGAAGALVHSGAL